MNKLVVTLTLALMPFNFAIAAGNDPCQLLGVMSASSVLDCYKNQTDSARLAARNNFKANFPPAFSSGDGKFLMPPSTPAGKSNESTPPSSTPGGQKPVTPFGKFN